MKRNTGWAEASEIPAFAGELAKALALRVDVPRMRGPTSRRSFSPGCKGLEGACSKCVVIRVYQDKSVTRWRRRSMRPWNAGKTSVMPASVAQIPSDQIADLKALVADLNAGQVNWLVILSGNPIYTAPAILSLPQRLRRRRTRLPGARIERDRASGRLARAAGALS